MCEELDRSKDAIEKLKIERDKAIEERDIAILERDNAIAECVRMKKQMEEQCATATHSFEVTIQHFFIYFSHYLLFNLNI